MIWHPSPNFGPRRGGLRPELIVIHFTAMQTAQAALERLCTPEHEVSAHYLIGPDGTLWQLVDEAERAWHAGHGFWAGRDDVNSRSIGIELDNTGLVPFSAPQMDRLSTLLTGIRARWGIAPEGVIGHSDFAPTRKADPGPKFDWHRLAKEGHSVWPEAGAEPSEPDGAAFLAALGRFGYPVDEGLDALLTAFRVRFRPGVAGPLTARDMAVALDLARRFPVDPSAPKA